MRTLLYLCFAERTFVKPAEKPVPLSVRVNAILIRAFNRWQCLLTARTMALVNIDFIITVWAMRFGQHFLAMRAAIWRAAVFEKLSMNNLPTFAIRAFGHARFAVWAFIKPAEKPILIPRVILAILVRTFYQTKDIIAARTLALNRVTRR